MGELGLSKYCAVEVRILLEKGAFGRKMTVAAFGTATALGKVTTVTWAGMNCAPTQQKTKIKGRKL
jgi:hypothetical protein